MNPMMCAAQDNAVALLAAAAEGSLAAVRRCLLHDPSVLDRADQVRPGCVPIPATKQQLILTGSPASIMPPMFSLAHTRQDGCGTLVIFMAPGRIPFSV
jgi:hypothetical protein